MNTHNLAELLSLPELLDTCDRALKGYAAVQAEREANPELVKPVGSFLIRVDHRPQGASGWITGGTVRINVAGLAKEQILTTITETAQASPGSQFVGGVRVFCGTSRGDTLGTFHREIEPEAIGLSSDTAKAVQSVIEWNVKEVIGPLSRAVADLAKANASIATSAAGFMAQRVKAGEEEGDGALIASTLATIYKATTDDKAGVAESAAKTAAEAARAVSSDSVKPDKPPPKAVRQTPAGQFVPGDRADEAIALVEEIMASGDTEQITKVKAWAMKNVQRFM